MEVVRDYWVRFGYTGVNISSYLFIGRAHIVTIALPGP
jgi:hypothetical protein